MEKPHYKLTPDFVENATDALREVINDARDWWVPKTPSHQIFETARMKFVQGNLNYFDFINMVRLAGHNPAPVRLPVCMQVAKDMRSVLDKTNCAFGRMNVWKVPVGGYIQAHIDPFQYHFNISRHLLFLNGSASDSQIRINREKVEAKAGDLLTFYPAYELHEFKNESKNDWYFLSVDFWLTGRLHAAQLKTAGISPKGVRYMSDD